MSTRRIGILQFIVDDFLMNKTFSAIKAEMQDLLELIKERLEKNPHDLTLLKPSADMANATAIYLNALVEFQKHTENFSPLFAPEDDDDEEEEDTQEEEEEPIKQGHEKTILTSLVGTAAPLVIVDVSEPQVEKPQPFIPPPGC